MKRSLLILLTSAISLFASALEYSAEAPTVGLSKRKKSTYNVGQIYAGGNVGVCIPMGIKTKGMTYGFNDFAKTGFAISADGMYQVNQAIGVGADLGFKNYGQSEDGVWVGLSQRGVIEANYRTLDLGLTGRVFIGQSAARPFIGVNVGGALLMNSLSFTPSTNYSSVMSAWDYKTNNVSAVYGLMTGFYFKAGHRTLLSLQGRFSWVPTLKEGTMNYVDSSGNLSTVQQNQHGNQHNVMVTLGMHIGTQSNNKH